MAEAPTWWLVIETEAAEKVNPWADIASKETERINQLSQIVIGCKCLPG